MTHLPILLDMVSPNGSDLWAFYILTGLWVGILGTAWVLVNWFGNPSVDEGHRGL